MTTDRSRRHVLRADGTVLAGVAAEVGYTDGFTARNVVVEVAQ